VTLYGAADPGGPPARLDAGADPHSDSADGDLAARLRAARRDIRRRVESRGALLDMVRAVSADRDPAGIASAIVDQAAGWLPVPGWAVVASDPSGQLTLLASRRVSPAGRPAVEAVAAWVIQHGGTYLAASLGADPRSAGAPPVAALAFPLDCRGGRTGALVGIDALPSSQPPHLPPAVLRGICSLLEPAAAALDAALHLKRAEALSVTDDLTQLYNSRYLNQVLRREIKRALRSGRPLSLLFVDLDGFKTVNDRHGHLSGSRALVEVAAVIRGSARETDGVARFGGDEFALVLPDTGRDGAFAVGERIRERIAAHAFLRSAGLDIRLTASVGVATLPDVAASADELVAAADAAMYAVKDRGKNGIQAADPPSDNQVG
jgi:diguanylate cyclase (GGDEF)-like protein